VSGLRAVVFDWGGTLTPHHEVDLLDLWRVAARVLAPEREHEMADALAAAEREWWRRADDGGHESGTTDDVLALACERTGLDAHAVLREEALSAHLEAWGEHTACEPDAKPVLEALRERGIATALLSNTHWPREWHERWLERDGVLELLDARVYTSDLAHTKPHAEAFGAALGALGVEPSEALMVGDRPRDDIAGAKACGMRAVLRPNPFVPSGPVEPDAVIGSLPELLALVDAWRV
jgi:putative hydrolase of the HAD superfamily